MSDELSFSDASILEHAFLVQARLLESDGDHAASAQVQLRASLLRSLSHEDDASELACLERGVPRAGLDSQMVA